MMTCCAHCGEIYELTMREYRKINAAESFFCSAECLLSQMAKDVTDEFIPGYYPSEVRDEERFGNTSIWSKEYNITFRSRYDLAAYDYLVKKGLNPEYEPYEFNVGTTIYIPDIYVRTYDAFIELKGVWNSGQKSKLAEFRKQHPAVRLYLSTWLIRKSWDV